MDKKHFALSRFSLSLGQAKIFHVLIVLAFYVLGFAKVLFELSMPEQIP